MDFIHITKYTLILLNAQHFTKVIDAYGYFYQYLNIYQIKLVGTRGTLRLTMMGFLMTLYGQQLAPVTM